MSRTMTATSGCRYESPSERILNSRIWPNHSELWAVASCFWAPGTLNIILRCFSRLAFLMYACVCFSSSWKRMCTGVCLFKCCFWTRFDIQIMLGSWLFDCMPDHSLLMMPRPKGTRQNGTDDSCLWTCVCDVNFSYINHSVRQWEQGNHGVKRRHGPWKHSVLEERKERVTLLVIICLS